MSNFTDFFERPDVMYTAEDGLMVGNVGWKRRRTPRVRGTVQPTLVEYGASPYHHGVQLTPYYTASTQTRPLYTVSPAVPRTVAFVVPNHFGAAHLTTGELRAPSHFHR